MPADPIDKTNILNRQYKSIYTCEDTSTIPKSLGQPYESMEEIIVTEEGIRKLLRKLNPNKACGPDLMETFCSNFLVSGRSFRLGFTFVYMFYTFKFLPQLKIGRSLSLKGDYVSHIPSSLFPGFKASNYRPMSLTSLCCKVQEHITSSNILRHLDDNSILTDCQHGFGARRSCETHELAEFNDKRRQMDLIILDFLKAFDCVPHQRLLAKIDH